MKDEMRDMWCWMNGLYTLDAISVTVANVLASKGTPPQKYKEQPILAAAKEQNRVLTEEEKKEQVQMLWNALSVMQSNFERTHGDKNNA